MQCSATINWIRQHVFITHKIRRKQNTTRHSKEARWCYASPWLTRLRKHTTARISGTQASGWSTSNTKHMQFALIRGSAVSECDASCPEWCGLLALVMGGVTDFTPSGVTDLRPSGFPNADPGSGPAHARRRGQWHGGTSHSTPSAHSDGRRRHRAGAGSNRKTPTIVVTGRNGDRFTTYSPAA